MSQEFFVISGMLFVFGVIVFHIFSYIKNNSPRNRSEVKTERRSSDIAHCVSYYAAQTSSPLSSQALYKRLRNRNSA
jgi:hypothetical protein